MQLPASPPIGVFAPVSPHVHNGNPLEWHSMPLAHYTPKLETLLRDESHKADVLAAMHTLAYIWFNKCSIAVNLPVIVITSVIGFLLTLTLFPGQATFLGALSIGVSVLKTIDNYFSWTKRSEAHRMVALSYAKLSKIIKIQLALDAPNRMSPNEMLAILKNDLQNLRESSPVIPQRVLDAYRHAADGTPAAPAVNHSGLHRRNGSMPTLYKPSQESLASDTTLPEVVELK